MKQFRSMLYPYIAWLSVMVVLPMLLILLYAFTTQGNDVTTFRFTLDNFVRFFSDSVFLDVLRRSLLIAVLTTVICVLLGYPIAYVIAKGPEKSSMFLVAYFLVASSAVAMLRKSFSASKIRRMSMPFLMDSSTNFSTTSSW